MVASLTIVVTLGSILLAFCVAAAVGSAPLPTAAGSERTADN